MPRTINLAEKIAQLQSFHKQEGRAPSYAEMAALFGYKSKNTAYDALEVQNGTDLGRAILSRVALRCFQSGMQRERSR